MGQQQTCGMPCDVYTPHAMIQSNVTTAAQYEDTTMLPRYASDSCLHEDSHIKRNVY